MRIRSLLIYLTIMPVVVGCNHSGIKRTVDTDGSGPTATEEVDTALCIPAFLADAGVGRDWSGETIRVSQDNVGEMPVALTRRGMERLHLPAMVMDSSEVASDYSIGIIGWREFDHGRYLVGFQPDDFGTYVSGYIGLYESDGRLADALYVDRWYDSYWETGDDDEMIMSGYQWAECICDQDDGSSFRVQVHVREQYYDTGKEHVDSCTVTYRYHIADGKIVYDGSEFDAGSYGADMKASKDALYELQWGIWCRPLSDPQMLDVWDRLIRRYGIGEVTMWKEARRSFVWQAYASDPKRFWTWVYDHRDDENAMLLNMLQNIFVHDTTLSEEQVRADIDRLVDPAVRDFGFALLDGCRVTE